MSVPAGGISQPQQSRRSRHVLAAQHRMRTSVQFSETTRSGVRAGRRNVVLYAHRGPSDSPTLCGFIVSKAVGNAVTRNKVKRRLRTLAREAIQQHPLGLRLVIRALPASAHTEYSQLATEVRSAWGTLERKLKRSHGTAADLTRSDHRTMQCMSTETP